MPQLDFDGANSKVSADKIQGQSGTTVTVPTGHKIAGTDANSITINGVNAVAVAPSTSGNVLTSTGSAWASQASAGGGKLIKRTITTNSTVGSGSGQMPADNTQPLFSEGNDLGLSTAYAPTSATNVLWIMASVYCDHSLDNSEHGIYLCKDSGNALVCAMNQGKGTGSGNQLHLFYKVTAGTTSSETWTVRGGCGASGRTLYWNQNSSSGAYGGYIASHLVIDEYEA
jgi:hypothetical protein